MFLPSVSVGIVTWHPDPLLARCIASVRAQDHPSMSLHVWDNESTPESQQFLASLTSPDERTCSKANVGFSTGHNALIRRATSQYYLCLNPDAVLSEGYIGTLVAALEANMAAGSATGRLLRLDDEATLDSTGIVMTPDQRHLEPYRCSAVAG